MEKCVFCEIISGQTDRKPIYRDESVVVLIPLTEVNPGHLLIIPTNHYESIKDVSPDILSKMSIVAQAQAKKLFEKPKVSGINILNANRKDAGQSVFHFHLHVVPRYPGDGLNLWLRREI